VARRVADKEDAVLRTRAKLVGDPVALVADRRSFEVVGQQDRRVLDVEARVERTDPDSLLIAGGKVPAVAGGDVTSVDPDLEVVRAALRMQIGRASCRERV